MYDVDYQVTDDGNNDLILSFGKEPLIHITEQEVKDMGLDRKTSFKFFHLVVQKLEKSVEFKTILTKSDTLDSMIGKENTEHIRELVKEKLK